LPVQSRLATVSRSTPWRGDVRALIDDLRREELIVATEADREERTEKPEPEKKSRSTPSRTSRRSWKSSRSSRS
jgi:hypothetical protein